MKKLSKEQSDWLRSDALQRVFDVLEKAGGVVRVNGGAVRNALMGLSVNDVDLSTEFLPEKVMQVCEAAGFKTIPTGIDHGTVNIIVDGSSFEVTTLREDMETDGRHAVVKFGTDWTKDAERRDLTINALYCDRKGNIFDPLDGYPDIERRLVRFIGSAEQRIKEDYLRILRFFRFFAWYGAFRPDADGLKACAKLKSGLEGISSERIWIELKKLLGADDPSRALLWMRTTNVLNVVLPESEKWGIDSLAPMMRAEEAGHIPKEPLLRLMAMIPPRDDVAAGLAKRLKLSSAETDRVKYWTKTAKVKSDTSEADFAKICYSGDLQAIQDVISLEIVSLHGRDLADSAELKSQLLLLDFAKKYDHPTFPVTGDDLMQRGFNQGAELGRTLKSLEQDWIDSDFTLSKKALLESL